MIRRLPSSFPDGWHLTARASGVLALRVTSAALAFGSTVLITRLFGASNAGTFFLSLAIVTVCSTLAQVGIDLPLLRMTAIAKDQGDWSTVQSLTRKSIVIGIVAGSALTLLVWVLSPWVSRLLTDQSLQQMLPIMALGIVPYTLVLLLARALSGINHPALSELVHRTGFQIVFIALIVALSLTTGDGLILGWAFSAAYWAVLLAGKLLWTRSTGSDEPSSTTDTKVLLRPGAPLLAATSLFLAITWADTLMIGYFSTSASVGVYGTALRVSATITMILTAATVVVAPRFAALYDRGDHRELQRLLKRAASGCALVALPVCGLLIAFAEPIMTVFGDEFTIGGRAMSILVVGELVKVSFGLVGPLLVMAGRERRVLEVVAISAALNVLLNLLLIPEIGIEGAAIATASAYVIMSSGYAYFVRRDLDIALLRRRVA